MNRRSSLFGLLLLVTSSGAAFKLTRYSFRIKTKSGGTIGNVVIEATDIEAAKVKLNKRYPGCTILSVKSK